MKEKDREKSTKEIINLVSKECDFKFKFLKEENNKLDRSISEIRTSISKETDKLHDKIDASEARMLRKLEAINASIKGNGNIGYSEQLRTLKRRLSLCIILIVLLFGFKFNGLSLQQWMDGFFSNNANNANEVENIKETNFSVNNAYE